MESTGLKNSRRYLTVMYSTSRPSCRGAVSWTESRPLCELYWFPFKCWLMSQMCKKLAVGWLYFKKFEYVKMAVISPGTLFCPKFPYEKM